MPVTGANHACICHCRSGDRKRQLIRNIQGVGETHRGKIRWHLPRSRGSDLEVLENDLWSPARVVITEFPDMRVGTVPGCLVKVVLELSGNTEGELSHINHL